MKEKITVETLVSAPAEKVWELFTRPDHIVRWNAASPDWHTPRATNDLAVGGSFDYRMEAKDGSAGFDLKGTYTQVVPHKELSYILEDGRQVQSFFAEEGGTTRVTITFEAESENSIAMQQAGWQAILNSFKAYVEG